MSIAGSEPFVVRGVIPHEPRREPGESRVATVLDEGVGGARLGCLQVVDAGPDAVIGLDPVGETGLVVLAGTVLAGSASGGRIVANPYDVVFYPRGLPVSAAAGQSGAVVVATTAYGQDSDAGSSAPSGPILRRRADEIATQRLGGLPPEYGLRDAGDHWYVTGDVGSRRLQVRITRFRPHGGHFGLHRHRSAEEYFLVLTGGGRQLHPDGDGPAELAVRPGDVVFTPVGDEHGWANDGADTLALAGWWGAHDPESSGYEQTLPHHEVAAPAAQRQVER
jgi:quercetin dioxygenase-like cupin family protein